MANKSREVLMGDRNELIYELAMDKGYSHYEIGVMFNLPADAVQRIVNVLYTVKLRTGGRE